MEAEGKAFAKTAKAPPLQSALRGFIARYRVDHPYNPYGGMPHATASGKGGMPNRNVINAHAFIATRYDKCATRHATSLLRPMRPAPPSITLRVLGSKPLESRMDTGLGAIPNARCVRRATFAV